MKTADIELLKSLSDNAKLVYLFWATDGIKEMLSSMRVEKLLKMSQDELSSALFEILDKKYEQDTAIQTVMVEVD